MHTYILLSTYTASDYTLTCYIVIDGAWLCTGLLMDFQGLSSISTVQITTRALLFLVTFVMEFKSMGYRFVSEVIKVVKT